MYRLPPFFKIEKFYVESIIGIWLHDKVIPFGTSLEQEHLPDALKHNLYVRFQIGSAEQVQRVASKRGLKFELVESPVLKTNEAQIIEAKAPLKNKLNS